MIDLFEKTEKRSFVDDVRGAIELWHPDADRVKAELAELEGKWNGMFGEDGAAKTLKKGAVVLDCSSINPIASREIAAELGSSERSVEGKLYRVRKKLQEMLEGEGYER